MSLVKRHTLAVSKPVEGLESADIRLLISQHEAGGASYQVVARAIEILNENPLIDTEFFQGDLFKAVLQLPEVYWQAHPDHWQEAHALLSKLDQSKRMIDSAATAVFPRTTEKETSE